MKQWEIIALEHLFSLVSIYLVKNRNANIWKQSTASRENFIEYQRTFIVRQILRDTEWKVIV